MATNDKFEIRGLNHLALVCKDMKRTVDFYTGVLGMPLTKTISIPGGGQHFFFDMGGSDQLAFFWFPDAPESVPGITHPASRLGEGSITTAHASMNHLAFDVPPEKIDEYAEKLAAAGIHVSPVVNHDDSEMGASMERTPSTFVRSLYFQDPDGMMLEFAAWTRELGPEDVNLEPMSVDA